MKTVLGVNYFFGESEKNDGFVKADKPGPARFAHRFKEWMESRYDVEVHSWDCCGGGLMLGLKSTSRISLTYMANTGTRPLCALSAGLDIRIMRIIAANSQMAGRARLRRWRSTSLRFASRTMPRSRVTSPRRLRTAFAQDVCRSTMAREESKNAFRGNASLIIGIFGHWRNWSNSWCEWTRGHTIATLMPSNGF